MHVAAEGPPRILHATGLLSIGQDTCFRFHGAAVKELSKNYRARHIHQMTGVFYSWQLKTEVLYLDPICSSFFGFVMDLG